MRSVVRASDRTPPERLSARRRKYYTCSIRTVGAYVVRRLLTSLVTLWLVMTTLFVIFMIIPGGTGKKGPAGISPVTILLAGRAPPMEKLQQIQHDLGLDEPLPIQYGRYVARLATLDFGYSYQYFEDVRVWPVVKQAFWPTVQLSLGAAALAVGLGLTAGILSARSERTWKDRSLMGFATVFLAVPTFVTAMLGLFWLARRGIPVRGTYVSPTEDLGQWLRAMWAPWVALALPFAGVYARVVRGSMKDVRGEEYIRTAYAKGLTERQVLRHQVRSSILPVLTLLGLHIAAIVSSTIIVEQIFEIPGMGFLISTTTFTGDFPVISAVTFLGALIVMGTNMFVDFLYGFVDPRITRENSA